MKKIARTSLGIICIILGFLALITPLTPGSWLILIGLEILGLGFLLEGRLFRWLKRKRKGRLEDSVKETGQKTRS
ncbi:MAG: PGPGW domain-containing protein [Planctomycetota bacterium]|jgi:uncharacterized protein YqgC (DUF456 family)